MKLTAAAAAGGGLLRDTKRQLQQLEMNCDVASQTYWKDLSDLQKSAARTLGYDQGIWPQYP